LAAAVVVLTASLQAQEPQPSLSIPSIVTRGEAIIRRAPDRAYVIAAVETRAKTPKDAQQLNATAMTAVQQRLTAAGIGRDAIRTLGYSIQPQYDFANGRRTLRDYLARNSVEVRLDDVTRAGEIADTAVQAGATNISDIRFDLKDRAGAEREALRLAVADARARADAAAMGAGRVVDRVLRIEDSRDSEPPRPYLTMRATAAVAADQAPSTPIDAGDLEIRAHVTLTVAIK
jgi:uncharacterized protein YggE